MALCLAFRVLPDPARGITRHPIPKPDGGERPLSLTHAIYAEVSGIVAKTMTAAIEEGEALPDSVHAYRPEHGTWMCLFPHVAAVEHALRSGEPLYILSDDWEKFYDAVPLDIILLCLRAGGCPERGYAEWAAEVMHDRGTWVSTPVGFTTRLTHDCGFLQGSAFSCCAVNFVVATLHRLWKRNTTGTTMVSGAAKALLHMLGYCDDNTAYLTTYDELIKAEKAFGAFSMGARVGRNTSATKGAKVFGFNMHKDKTWLDAGSPTHITSVAWSRAAPDTDGPNRDAPFPDTGAIRRSIIPIVDARTTPEFEYKYLGAQLGVALTPASQQRHGAKVINKACAFMSHSSRGTIGADTARESLRSTGASAIHACMATGVAGVALETADRTLIRQLRKKHRLHHAPVG